jgi:hypothetical protein
VPIVVENMLFLGCFKPGGEWSPDTKIVGPDTFSNFSSVNTFAKITTILDLFNLFNTYKIDSTTCWHAMLSCYFVIYNVVIMSVIMSNVTVKCFINMVPNPDFSDGYVLLLSLMSSWKTRYRTKFSFSIGRINLNKFLPPHLYYFRDAVGKRDTSII